MPAAVFITTHSAQWGKIQELGVGYVAAALQEEGYSSKVFQLSEEDTGDLQSLCEELKKSPPLLLGFALSHRTPQLDRLREICRLLRAAIPNSHFTAGGYWASFNSENLLKSIEFLDSVVVGEGEATCKALLVSLSTGKTLAGITGLATQTTSAVVTTFRTSTLDDLPEPYRDFDQLERDDVVSISTSRGCMAHCTFCNVPAWMRKFGTKEWRGRSTSRVVDEIEQMVNLHGLRRFWIVDSSFEDPLPSGLLRMREFANEILNRSLDIRYYVFHRAETIADEVSDELLILMKQSGLRRVFIGVEAANDAVLKSFAKRARRSQIEKALEKLRRVDILYRCGFIMFLPDGSVNNLEDNIKFLGDLGVAYSTGDLFTRLELYTGSTEVTRLANKGLVLPDYWCNPYAYLFEDREVEWLANNICPLKEKLAKTAKWETIHTANLIENSARYDRKVCEDKKLKTALQNFSDDLEEVQQFLMSSNVELFEALIQTSYTKSLPSLDKIISEHILVNHVEAVKTIELLSLEFLHSVRARHADFCY